MTSTTIITLNENNIDEYPPVCFLNLKNIGQQMKNTWAKQHLSEGLTIKLLFADDAKKPVGYIEYIPGESAWRAVEAPGYLFIHCIWISPKSLREQGLGSMLVKECVKDAEAQGKLGVCVMVSDGSFMADETLFIKNGFQKIESYPPYSLCVKQVQDGPISRFKDIKTMLSRYKGLHILYSKQCPWVARFMEDMKDRLGELKVTITELTTAKEAQNVPSLYATFTLINGGKVLADHYISARRFENIIKKEI
jgi:ribosomal protein S18 acetylase RimI-like enzyme